MTRRQCRITVAGILSERFDRAFDGFTLERTAGTTVLRGVVRDSSALYGVLGRVQDLGMELLSVESRPVESATRDQRERGSGSPAAATRSVNRKRYDDRSRSRTTRSHP